MYNMRIKGANQASNKKNRYQPSFTNIQLEEHTKILASMCPDEILDYYDDYQTRGYYTTLMLGDVSGFTELAEKYTKTGVGGPSKLSETLNSYIGAMVQEILYNKGDVLKFSGDAFIVMWKLKEGMIMSDLALLAMQTACVIQKHFGTYDTDVGVTMRVKLAIASGKTYFTSIGDPETMSYYIITGKPVWDVKFAEKLCRGGDIIVAPSSWQWANPNEYIYEKLSDGIHTLIIACSAKWYQAVGFEDIEGEENNFEKVREKRRETKQMQEPLIQEVREGRRVAFLEEDVDETVIRDAKYFEEVDYSLRPKVIEAAKARLKNKLRSYLLKPVIRSVEMNEPMDHLTEMRQVVIVFINVITTRLQRQKLIATVDETYKVICGIVVEMQGCVNKMSLFDKDLIFLCIFGLRGYKHEMESQMGLRCATKVREDVLMIQNITSVTVAVTTGMTYCGVVGHVLRREYTVIGIAVNKAARLMVAYSDMVVCDRESFLRSRLEAKHFTLLEAKQLKGITHVGPVYEFEEEIKFVEARLPKSTYPLLGREQEIKIFKQILNKLKHYNMTDKTKQPFIKINYNTLIIKGEPRIGKTRLLDEFAQKIPMSIPYNYVSLVIDNVKVSYSLLQLIFYMPMGISASSTMKEREDKLLAQLGHIHQKKYLCILNQPFNVNFALSEQYKAMSEKEKHAILEKFISKLMQDCFKKLWLVIVDDAEFSDFDSMSLFSTMVQVNTVFFIFSIGHKLNADYKMHPSLLSRAKVIELKCLNKWYHAALVCQLLNVNAIPVELEKLIQEKSDGNPGWIESYLLSLLQSGSFEMTHVRETEAEEMGYVLPPNFMMKRETIDEDEEIREDEVDRWVMYKTAYREVLWPFLFSNNSYYIQYNYSIYYIYIKEEPIAILVPTVLYKPEEEKVEEDKKEVVPKIPEVSKEDPITICNLVEGFETEEGEITMDVMILKIFDSLTPLDQLLLKCASVLGEIINRSMLHYLMKDRTIKEIGIAIQKLFEIRIFGCAQGDFTMSKRPLIFHRNIRKTIVEGELECECIGLIIPKELADMPRYASCGLMRFKMMMFRETTYRLLTETQKMDLHSKALKYLQWNTRRCITCGELPFIKLLGKTLVPNKRRKTVEVDEIEDVPVIRKKQPCFGIFEKVRRKATKTFSNVDFSNCQCHLILIAVYTQMLEHWYGIGKEDMILAAILEFVEVCLLGYNLPQARKLLSEAEDLLKRMYDYAQEEVVTIPYLAAKIQMLQGRCLLDDGLFSEAKEKLKEAIATLGYNFPRHPFKIYLDSTIEYYWLKWRLICPIRKWKTEEDEQAMDYIELLANCLAQLYTIYKEVKGMKKQARLSALWSLNAALNSSRDFLILCTSLANVINTAHIYRNKMFMSYLENIALNICAQKRYTLEFQELNAIAQVYAGIFFLRWSSGEIHRAIKIGFITLRMVQTVNSDFLKLQILLKLVHLLMLSCRFSEVVALLRELEFGSQNILDKSGNTWYYAMCIDLQLDTGFIITSFQNCEQYYLREGDNIFSFQDPEAERRYFTCMWLMCIRMQQWEAIHVWEARNVTPESIMDEHIGTTLITALKKLEGMLLIYVREVNNKNINAINTMMEIKKQFKHIEKTIKIVKIVMPRYMLLRAYYYMILSQKKTALNMLKRTMKLSVKMDNRMIYSWANHCQQAWLGIIPSVREDLWTEKSIRKLDDEIVATDVELVVFTFPLPHSNII